MAQKADLIALVQVEYEEILRFRSTFSKDERDRSGLPDRWEPRDTLCHIGEWQRRLADQIAVSRRGEDAADRTSFQVTNDAIFETYRHQSWDEILSLLEDAHAGLLEQLEQLSDAEINDPQHFAWLEGRPMWRHIAGSDFLHIMAHLVAAYLERRDHENAGRVRELEAQWAARLDPSPAWQGITQYNLACHYALSGEREKALEKLKPALRLNPTLVEFSQQDTDLVSLHKDPAFLNLLEDLRP